LFEDPTTSGTNTKAEFSIREGVQEFSVYGVAFLLQSLGNPRNPCPSVQQVIRTEVC
jgi:hypothetical protein